MEHLVTPFNTLVITQTTGGNHNVLFMTNGTIPHTDCAQVVIASKCVYSVPSIEILEVKLNIAGILGQRFVLEWNDKRERMCELLTLYELQHKSQDG